MQTLHFPSQDGLTITADYYPVAHSKGSILLCHRSHFNRGEYHEIAPKLNKLGFSCLAIDQRSGMNVLGTINETSSLAKQQKLPTGYLDARPDIEAAISFLYEKNNNKPILALGSSYSASLLLLITQNNPKVKALITFSPGEYLKKTDVSQLINNFDKPLYVTSTKKEVPAVKQLIANIDHKFVTFFEPSSEGHHGARALWERSEGHEAYWQSLTDFLNKIP